MEPTKIGQLLPKELTENQLAPTTISTSLEPYTKTETAILKAKYAKPPVGKQTPAEVVYGIKLMLVNIHASTGWELPVLDMQRIVEKQLIETLLESYANVNFTEIEFAFRTYGGQVTEFGKPFNMSLFTQVLDLYLHNRKLVSEVEQSKKEKAPELPFAALTTEQKTEWLNETKAAHLCGSIPLLLLPPALYDFAVLEGLLILKEGEKKEAWKRVGSILNPAGDPGVKILHERAVHVSKQILLSNFFKQA